MKSVMENTYFKALGGVNWWPVAVLAGFMFVVFGVGSFFLEAHTAKTSTPAAQRPVKPSELREDPTELVEAEQIIVPVEPEVSVVRENSASVPTSQRQSVTPSVAPKPAEIVRQINEARRASGVATVKEDALLDKSSTLKVTDMIARNYWSHSPPDGSGSFATIQKVGYSYSYVGENLAYGQYPSSPETTIVQNWLKSSGHRKNMLNAHFKDLGIAVQKAQSYNGNKEVYVIVTQYATKR